jgi:hypothetical protein
MQQNAKLSKTAAIQIIKSENHNFFKMYFTYVLDCFASLATTIGVILLLLAFVHPSLHAVTIGSDTAPSRLNTQQTLNTGDRVASFPALYGGLALSSLTVTATWDCVFGLGGPLAMNSGTLLLNTDLTLCNNSTIVTMGGFNGQNHLLSLAPTNSYIHTSNTIGAPCTISNLTMALAADVYMQNCHITFNGNNTIEGGGFNLTLLPTATLILASNATLQLKDITINGMSNTTLYATSVTTTLILNNATINLSNNYTFSNGSLEIYNDVLITGSSFGIYYSSSLACTIQPFSQLMIDLGVTFSYVPIPTTNTGFSFVNKTSQFYLRGGIFYVGVQGLYLLKGTMLVDKTSYFVSATTGTITTLGDGANPSSDFTLNILPAATLNIVQGFLTFYNV